MEKEHGVLTNLADHSPDLPFDRDAIPDEVRVSEDRSRLGLVWGAGPAGDLESSRIRLSCRCAWCTRDRALGAFPADFDGVRIRDVQVIGDYAANITFSDGHSRGIFPWTYLRQLSLAASQAPDAAPRPASVSPR
jgi:DUF971 family protein